MDFQHTIRFYFDSYLQRLRKKRNNKKRINFRVLAKRSEERSSDGEKKETVKGIRVNLLITHKNHRQTNASRFDFQSFCYFNEDTQEWQEVQPNDTIETHDEKDQKLVEAITKIKDQRKSKHSKKPSRTESILKSGVETPEKRVSFTEPQIHPIEATGKQRKKSFTRYTAPANEEPLTQSITPFQQSKPREPSPFSEGEPILCRFVDTPQWYNATVTDAWWRDESEEDWVLRKSVEGDGTARRKEWRFNVAFEDGDSGEDVSRLSIRKEGQKQLRELCVGTLVDARCADSEGRMRRGIVCSVVGEDTYRVRFADGSSEDGLFEETIQRKYINTLHTDSKDDEDERGEEGDGARTEVDEEDESGRAEENPSSNRHDQQDTEDDQDGLEALVESDDEDAQDAQDTQDAQSPPVNAHDRNEDDTRSTLHVDLSTPDRSQSQVIDTPGVTAEEGERKRQSPVLRQWESCIEVKGGGQWVFASVDVYEDVIEFALDETSLAIGGDDDINSEGCLLRLEEYLSEAFNLGVEEVLRHANELYPSLMSSERDGFVWGMCAGLCGLLEEDMSEVEARKELDSVLRGVDIRDWREVVIRMSRDGGCMVGVDRKEFDEDGEESESMQDMAWVRCGREGIDGAIRRLGLSEDIPEDVSKQLVHSMSVLWKEVLGSGETLTELGEGWHGGSTVHVEGEDVEWRGFISALDELEQVHCLVLQLNRGETLFYVDIGLNGKGVRRGSVGSALGSRNNSSGSLVTGEREREEAERKTREAIAAGSEVSCRFADMPQWYNATVTDAWWRDESEEDWVLRKSVEGDGTARRKEWRFNVAFADGDSGEDVSRLSIRKEGQKQLRELCVGTLVDARCADSEGRMRRGIVCSVVGEDTYRVRFADGSSEDGLFEETIQRKYITGLFMDPVADGMNG